MNFAHVVLLVLPLCAGPALALQSATDRAQVEGARGPCTLAIYEVRDLVERLTLDFAPPELGVFEQLVLAHLSPKLGDAPEQLQISRTGTLVANLRRDQQQWLDAFLQTQRSFEGCIEVQARLFKAPRGLLGKLGVESSAMLSSDTHRDAFVQRMASTADVHEITAPKLIVYANQRANISVLNQVAYVKDYTLEIVEPGRQEIADPQVAVINEGVILDLRATPLPGQLLVLDLKLHNSQILRPIRTRKIRLSATQPTEVEIGLPEVATVRIVSSVVLRDGASVVLSTPAQDDEGDIALVVTAKRVSAPATSTEAK
jgi:hypothetical protein